jgi:predicted nucleic acid-binding protein
MGSLNLPPSGSVYVDTQTLIYAIESNSTYAPVVDPFLKEVEAGRVELVTSELTVMEVLVRPIRLGDQPLIDRYEGFFVLPNVRLLPVTLDVLRSAARLRATIPKLRTPDAIHAASALAAGVSLFVTNDFAFRTVPGLMVEVLDAVIARP